MYPDESSRLLRLEQKIDFLFRHLGIDPSQVSLEDDFAPSFGDAFDSSSQPGLPSAFYDALRTGHKIQAVKIYHEVTGVGLKEAKSAVERMGR
jgi:hypothetical protein